MFGLCGEELSPPIIYCCFHLLIASLPSVNSLYRVYYVVLTYIDLCGFRGNATRRSAPNRLVVHLIESPLLNHFSQYAFPALVC